MGGGFGGCVADAAEEFSRAPEMPFAEMPSEPRMFLEKFKGTATFKQLQCFADARRRWKFDEEVDVVGSDVKFVNFESPSVSDPSQKKFAVHFQPVKFERVFRVFNFPDKMESVLSEAVLPGFQIHFLFPKSATRNKAHANFDVYFEEPSIPTIPNIQTKELNLLEDGDSSQNLKVWVSSSWM